MPNVALSLLLVFLALLVYGPVVHNGFINVDDNGYVVDNAQVHRGLTLSTLRWALSTFACENWHPLTWASHALDWQLFGPNAGGHHYVSAILHAVNAMLLFLLLERATGFTGRSFFVALVFAVHPANVESVAWAAERKTLLSLTFFLLAMLAYLRYARRPSPGRYAPVALLYALALMAKPQVVTFPFVLLLCDYWPLERFGRIGAGARRRFAPAPFGRLALEKLPLLLLSAADAWLTMLAQRNARLYAGTYPLGERLANAVVAYVRYLGHAIWPVGLAPAYPHPGSGLPLWSILASGAFLLLATLAALLLRRRTRYFLVGWLWFLGTLVPMIGLVQVGDQAMADRYLYIPLIGLLLASAWAIGEAAESWRVSPRFLAVPAGLVVVAFSLVTSRQITYWRDSERLWRYTLSVTRRNFIAHSYLAAVLTQDNRHEEAIQEYLAARELHAYPLTQVVYFADYELRHGHRADAMAEAQRVLRGTTDPAARDMAYRDLGIAYTQTAEARTARENFEQALALEPRDPYALMGLGLLAYRERDFSGAADYFSRTAAVDPSDFDFLLLGNAFDRSGRTEEAARAYAEARRVSRDYGEAQKKAQWFLTH